MSFHAKLFHLKIEGKIYLLSKTIVKNKFKLQMCLGYTQIVRFSLIDFSVNFHLFTLNEL